MSVASHKMAHFLNMASFFTVPRDPSQAFVLALNEVNRLSPLASGSAVDNQVNATQPSRISNLQSQKI